jgi:hypothetical protein
MQTPIIIENLEVWPEDLGRMAWEEAIDAVKKLGNGWRLPTVEEFETVLYPNRDKILNMNGIIYWSSTEYDNFSARYFNFSNGNVSLFNTNTTLYVRAVREITGDVAVDLLFRDF